MSEKIISMARSAEKNNDKLFPVFQKSLESDTHTEFAATAEKLAVWLSRDKAYYANARPKIIDLIETAHATVRRHSGFPDLPFHTSRCSNEVRPWAEPFMKIVRTVVPFLPLFTEPVLQLRLKALIQTLCEDIDGFLSQQTFVSPQAVTPSVSTSGTSRSTDSPASSLPSPSGHSHLDVVPVHQSPVATAGPTRPHPIPLLLEAPQVGQTSTQAGSASAATTPSETAPLTTTSTNLPTSTSAPLPPTPVAFGPRPHLPPNVRPVFRNLTAPAMANETAMNMEQSRPKAKKRKTLAVETDFIEADLMWFKDKSAVDSPIGLQGTHTADLTTAGSAGADVASSRVPTKPAAAAALVVRTPDVASPGPSNQSAAVLSTRDASVPLQDVVRPASSSRILTEDNTSVASAHVSPGSPVILGPSITRREPSSASPGVSSHGPENAHFATGEVLPSPLPTKKSKKRKRGPPGLKILPMLPTGSPRDILALEGSTDNTSAPVLTEESLETLTSTSFPLPHPVASASESQSNVSLEVREHPASSHMLEEVIPAVDTPTTMSMDELSRPTDGEDSSGDAEMKDPASSTPDQATTSPLPLFLPSSSQTSLYTPSARRSELDLNRSTTTLSASSSSSSIDTQAMVTVEDRVAESSPQTDALDEASASAPPAPVDTEIEPPDPQTPFANTSARVLSMVRGASSMTPASRPVVGDFELTMEELVQIARWNDRSRLSDDLSKTLCVSFVSYLVAQCVDASVGESQEVYDVDRCGPPASWPQDGTAFVVVNDGQSADRFIVSPPFITTVDKCIDLGTRSLRPGPNTLHLFQYRDHSDRFFVTLLHHPTRAQLAELQSARNKDREWQRFVEGLGRIELRVPRLFPSPPLNENFVSHS